jgi:hypothetical protein
VRRLLLVCATALLVARPLVPGEDPGLLSESPQTAGLWLTQLWLVLAVGWSAWRLWSRRDWRVGISDVCLAGAAACVLVSAGVAAAYQHPAWIVAGDWVGYLAAFVVLRQLAVREGEQAGFFAALQATGAALAFQAVALRLGTFPGAAGPFAGADSLAACLALLLPLMACGVLAARRTAAPRGLAAAAAALLGLGGLALWLTGSEAGVGGVLLVALAAGLAALRRMTLRRSALAVVAVALVIAAAGGVAYATGWTRAEADRIAGKVAVLREGWRVTSALLARAGHWGVGPGNFGRVYPHFMGPAGEELGAPRDFALELLATAGAGLLAAVLAAVAWLFFKVRRSPRGESPADPAGPEPPVRWEFYLGGMLGLTLGSVPRLAEAGAGGVLAEGVSAAARSAAWFLAFAVYERLPASGRGRALALAAGVAALLLTLCAADGIGFPSVAGLFWPAVALGLNAADARPAAWPGRLAPVRILMPPVLAAAALVYLFFISYPVTSANAAAYRAAANGRYFLDRIEARPKSWPASRSSDAIETQIIAPLERARARDPDDARYAVRLADWYGRLGAIFPATPRVPDCFSAALRFATLAEKLDPDGLEGPRAKVALLHLRAKVFEDEAKAAAKAKDEKRQKDLRTLAREQYRLAARVLAKAVERIPNDAGLRFALALEWFDAGNVADGRRQAAAALRLDKAATVPGRRLTDAQRLLAGMWLALTTKR